MLTGHDIVLISSIEWDFLWQGPQEIATRLARAGNRVLYVENTGVRSPGLKDAGRIVRRLKKWTSSLRSHEVREVDASLYVCSPLVLPPFGAAWQREVNRRLFLPRVARAARRLGMRDILLWTYLPTDTALDLIRLLRTPQSVVIYYYVDNFALLTPYVQQLERSEKELVETSDLVFATQQELAAHCEQWTDKVHIFPYGVNLDAFPLREIDSGNGTHGNLNGNAQTSAKDVTHSSPVIGYVGGLHRHVDFELLEVMARARPDWSWVCVGTIQTAASDSLAKLPNVKLIGAQPHDALADYIRNFDVCIVPYLNSPYTQTVVPTKINEYLAVGKPVVSTDIPAVNDFNEKHQVLLTTDTRPENFLHAIERALQLPLDATTIARRRAVATIGDWQTRLNQMSELIVAEMQAKEAAKQSTGR